jgi:hypothetical protein
MLQLGDKIGQLAGIFIVIVFVVWIAQYLFKIAQRGFSSEDDGARKHEVHHIEVRPGVRTFALWSLGLLFGICALLIIAENWRVILASVLALVLYAGYYVLLGVGILAALYFLVRFVKWSWYRH